MKTALVLEGGAMRGMFTAGVLDIFMDNAIMFDGIVGVSAGALFGVNLLSGQRGRVIRYNKKYNNAKGYMGFRPLLREGNFVSTKFAYHDVPHELDPFFDEEYKKSTVPFYAVLTNCETGEPEYIRIKSVFEQMDTLRASGSMPFVSKPVLIDGKKYLDGGISDSIPFVWPSENGFDKLVVVLTRDLDYRKEAMKPIIAKYYKRKYPKICEALIHRHEQYNNSVEKLLEWEKEGKAFIIRPTEPIDISRTERDPEKLQAVYEMGLRDGADRISAMLEYMK